MSEPEAGAQATEVQLKDQLLRLQADFENARKRWVKQQAEIQETANAGLLGELLEIYDDFQRAVEVGRAVHPEDLEGGTEQDRPSTGSGRAVSEFWTGVEMIARRLEGLLKSYGVGPMDAVGKPFDASRHEAVAHEATDTVPESTVLAELRKGYIMNGKVLRPAIVKVAVAPAEKNKEV